jgi:hypothetical protein
MDIHASPEVIANIAIAWCFAAAMVALIALAYRNR